MEGPKDNELVVAVKNGSVSAFKELVEQYQKRIYTIAYGVLQHHEDARDAAQEVFIKAYRKLSLFTMQSSFYTWLYRLAVNHCIDIKRKRDKRLSKMQEDGGVALQRAADSSDPLGKREVRQVVMDAIGSLPEKYRVIIILRAVEGLSYKEIAKVLQCSPGTVMSRLHKARKLLRDVLDPILLEVEGAVSP